MVKLYKRQGACILYAECWVHEGMATVHTGTVGNTRESWTRPCADEGAFVQEMQARYGGRGYAPWPEEELHWVVLQWPMQTMLGNEEERTFREEIQRFLGEHLGWLGLGHVDGYDVGLTQNPNPQRRYALNVFCVTVEPTLAVRSILKSLPGKLNRSGLQIATMIMDGDDHVLVYSDAESGDGCFYI